MKKSDNLCLPGLKLLVLSKITIHYRIEKIKYQELALPDRKLQTFCQFEYWIFTKLSDNLEIAQITEE